MSLIRNHPNRRSEEIMNGVDAYAEQTGASILADGVEIERHVLAGSVDAEQAQPRGGTSACRRRWARCRQTNIRP